MGARGRSRRLGFRGAPIVLHSLERMLARISRRSGVSQGLRLLDIRAKASIAASIAAPNLIELAKMSQVGITEQEVRMK
jgi:hypothetical protein